MVREDLLRKVLSSSHLSAKKELTCKDLDKEQAIKVISKESMVWDEAKRWSRVLADIVF